MAKFSDLLGKTLVGVEVVGEEKKFVYRLKVMY